MIRLMADDPGVVLVEGQARRITSWLLVLVAARGCHVERKRIVESPSPVMSLT
jgi:hypothetical protein